MATTDPKAGAATYTFASQPRAVSTQRSKFRDPAETSKDAANKTYSNMMHDPRIVRGNTYRAQVIPTAAQPDPIEIQKQQTAARKTLARQRASEKGRVASPKAIDGRAHMEIQTEPYLEELTDRVDEAEVETQTDAFLDRPPSPLFIPAKSGQDVATQIEAGELFDFDQEVKPILEVLIGKTMEQALMEVMEEDELALLRKHQRQFEELRNAELVEVQRREEAARRAREEKDRRIKQAQQVLAQEKETKEKIAARAFAQTYMAELVPSVFNSLSDGGYFYDQQEREVESQFMPWLMNHVDARLMQYIQARGLLEAIVQHVVQQRSAAAAASEAAAAAAAAHTPAAHAPAAHAETAHAASAEHSTPAISLSVSD